MNHCDLRLPGRFCRLLLCGVLLCAVQGALAKSFTLEQIRSYAYPENLISASEAPRIAWTADDAGRRNIWVADGRPLKARQVTTYSKDDGQELTSLAFSADGSRLVYVRGGEHGANWDGGLPVNVLSDPAGTKVEIWALDLGAVGAPRLVGEGDYPVITADGQRVAFLKAGEVWLASLEGAAEAHKLFTIRGAAQSLAWSPDGRKLAFVSDRDSHAMIGIYTDDSTSIRWVAPSTSRDDAPRWSADGKQIAFVRRPGKGGAPVPLLKWEPASWEIWVADAETGEAQKRYARPPVVDYSGYGLFMEWGAGNHIVFLSYQDGWPQLYSLPDKGAPLKLTDGKFEVEDIAVSRDHRSIIYSANFGPDPKDSERRHLFRVPVDKAQPTQLTTGSGLEWAPAALSDSRVAFFSATAQRPPVPASVVDGKAVEPVAAVPEHAQFPERELVIPQPVTFKSTDGLTIHGQLFKPSTSGGKHPAVVYLHGGPPRQMLLGWHYMGYYSNDYALNQYLASRGFIVLAVNYRLGIGYGREFQFPDRAGPRGASEYQDVQAAGRYLQTLTNVDPERIGIYGGSYGGYLTAMALARNSDLFAVGVDIHGVHNWADDEDYSQLQHPSHFEVAPDLKQALQTAWTSSPASDISQWRSPVLFIHGDDDRNVNFAQTVDLVQRLKPTGVKMEELVLVDETHSIQRYANELRMNAAIAQFLERYLMPDH